MENALSVMLKIIVQYVDVQLDTTVALKHHVNQLKSQRLVVVPIPNVNYLNHV